jgi:hypothetical protein
MMEPFEDYVEHISHDVESGIATEHSYRPYLKTLLERLRTDIDATNEPRRVECGAPDYVVTHRSSHGHVTIGYIEAKDIGANLDEAEESEQLKRYREGLSNLLLTDYLEFRWFVNGELRVPPAQLALMRAGRLIPEAGGTERVREALLAFLDRPPERLRSPRDLAERLARLTHLVRDIIVSSLRSATPTRTLVDLLTAFRQVLLPDLSQTEFADMYAQTLAYGLFAARVAHDSDEPFTRHVAGREIPKTNPFLRRLFAAITGPDFDDEPYAGLVDDIAQLLSMADMPAILAQFGSETRRHDPIVHFYETFLAAYDPALRELRGVYYTPEPVVSYIVRSVDQLLRSEFGLADGLGDTQRYGSSSGEQPRVLILDPACGTGTFLYAITDLLREAYRESGNAGMWQGFVRDQLLPRLHGFELLMAPYAVAHIKLALQLAGLDLREEEREAWEYLFHENERLSIFLTNSLEEAVERSELLFGEYISEEANAAADVKRQMPIMVVLGNPPYSGHSANPGRWITDLVYDYKRDVPGLDRPAQAKWLQDDYVKFIRFGEWRIGRTARASSHMSRITPTWTTQRSEGCATT